MPSAVQPAPHEPQAWALAKLSKYAERTVQLLHDLTDVREVQEQPPHSVGVLHGVEEDIVVRVGAMPKSAVAHAEGLAFIFRRKAGALLTFGHERCLLIARVAGENGGEAGWSAPLFCRGRTLGLGLSAGWMEMQVCWAIEGQANIQDLLKPQSLAGVNAAFLIDMNGARIRPVRRSAGSTVGATRGGLIAKYFITQACMVDLAVRGGSFRQDVQLNRALYGPSASPHDILQGRVPRPPGLEPVYALLAQLQQAAGPVAGPGMPRSSSQLRNLSAAGQGRMSTSRPGSRAPSRPLSRQGSGGELSRSAFPAGAAAAARPSPLLPLADSADTGSPSLLLSRKAEAPGPLPVSAPGSPPP
ncbi:hypothetical protein ABPG75_006210 [Micractinium tetrahymenae]